MDLGEGLMVAGIGCRAGVTGEQVVAAFVFALAALRGGAAEASGEPGRAVRGSAAGRESSPSAPEAAARREGLTAIAIPAAKMHEAGIQAAAAARGLPLLLIAQPDLEAANPATVTRSAHSMAAMNVHSVAEAAALAGAKTTASGPPNSTPRLLQSRVALGPVTCAIADTTPP